MTSLSLLLFVAAADPAKPAAPVSFYRDVRPIVQLHCQGCHQPAKAQGGYVMTAHKELMAAGNLGKPNVVPGQPESSMLLKQLVPQDGKPAKMPKGKDPLTEAQVALVRRWIAEGAKDDTPAAAARATVDADRPPIYELPPVVTSLEYSPDGSLLAVSGYHEVLLHKADGSGVVARLVGLAERVQAVAFAPDGKSLAVAGGSPGRFGEVQVWDVGSKKLKYSVAVTFDTLNGVSWSPDGSKIAFGGNDNNLRAIDAANGKQILFQGAHSDWVLDTVFSADGGYLVSVSRDRSVKLTEVETNRFIDNVTSITPGALKGGLGAVARRPFKDKKMVKAANIAISDTVEKVYDELLVGGADGQPRLYKMHREVKRVIGDDANKVREFEKQLGRIYALGFSADGKLGAAGSSLDGKGEVRVFQIDDAKRVSSFEGPLGPVFALAWRPDGKQVAVGGFDGKVRLHDPATGKLLKEFVPVPLTTAAAK
jgi:WD40 repeat protein/mono/diheme cytochrome c family protein